MLVFRNDVKTRKIQLWSTANNDYQFYGFGIEGSTLVYSLYDVGDDHVFFAGTSSTARRELARIKGTGGLKLTQYGSGSFTGTTAYTLAVDSSGNVIETTDGGGDITGSGTTNTVAKFTGAKAIGNGPVTFSGNDSTFAGNISTTGDININGGTNYNDKSNLYLSNGRTLIQSDIVNQTANGDTSLDFQTRTGGSLASAMFIDEFRRVGIGTTSPESGAKLDVRAGSGGKIVLGSYDANYKVVVEGGDQLNFYNGASGTTAYMNYAGPGNILLSRNLFVEANSSGGTSGTVRIKSDGKVGIQIIYRR